MNQQEQEKIGKIILQLFDLNNKSLFLAKNLCPQQTYIQKFANEINELGYQCFVQLNFLVQNSKPEGMSVDDFVHTPLMGG